MVEQKTFKTVLLIVAVIYFLSPVDFMSGIIVDDLVLLGTALVPFFKKPAYL